MLCREPRDISLTVLSVNCHDVTGRPVNVAPRGMKGPLNGITNQEKNKGLLESLEGG